MASGSIQFPIPEAIEIMSAEERQRYQNSKLRDLVRFAYANAPAVRNILDTAGIAPSQIRTVKDLERVPVTIRDEFPYLQRANPPFGGFLTVPADKLDWIGIHPGPQFEASFARGKGYKFLAKILRRSGFLKGDLVVNTFSYHLVPTGVAFDAACRYVGATVIPTGPGNRDLQVEAFYHLRANVYLGFARFFHDILKRAREIGYEPRRDFALRFGTWLGERAPELRRIVEEDYGIHTVEWYGVAPFGPLAYECSQKSGMHIDEDFIVEILDVRTGKQLGPGEEGHVVVTMFNKTFPVIRFGTGDLAFYSDETCACGRTSPRVIEITGRIGQQVKVRGMFIHPHEVEELGDLFTEISKFQVILTRHKTTLRDEIRARIEPAYEDLDRNGLAEEFSKSFQDKCRLRIDDVGFVPKGTMPEGAKVLVDERPWEIA